MSGYYLAPSLAVLREEINRRWPGRDRTSDGWIGDTAHQAGPSDHNPNSRGSVNAIDVDDDGVPFAEVFAAIRRHPSARYVIYERTLYHRLRGWRPEPYSGSNPHDKHFHLSIDQTVAAEQDTRPWGLLEDQMSEKAEAQINSLFSGMFYGGNSMGRSVDPDGTGSRPASNSVVAKLDYLLARVDAVGAQLEALAGRDLVDEPAVAAAVVAALDPAAFAAALPHDLAQRVADELAARLAT